MAEFKHLSWLLIWTYLTCVCNCQDSIVSVIQRLDQFEEDLFYNKEDMINMEKRIRNIIVGSKTALRAELRENIRDQVREAMAEILQGESLQDMVKSQVVSELRHLKQGYHQMKRQMHHVSNELKDFQDETSVFHETVLKKARVGNRENSSDVCVRDKRRLEIELQKCEVTTAHLKADIKRLMTTQKQKTALTVHDASPATHNDTSTSGSPGLTTLMTTPRLPVSTTSVTTQRRQEEKSRILIAPRWSSTQHQFRQLNIDSNSLSVYQYLTMKNVVSVAYVAKTRKLLIGLNNPRKIVSSALDTSQVTVLREGVQTYGMAVDEDRDIVFMTTEVPRHSISRMSSQGTDFTTIINLSNYGHWPSGITLDNKRKKIYASNGGKLFMVTYDGQGLATLATGSGMYAVTLDQTAGVLYYNNDKKLMKMTVSNNVSTEVTTLTARPCNMRLYRGTIYYGGCGSPIVGAVDVTYNTLEYTLNNMCPLHSVQDVVQQDLHLMHTLASRTGTAEVITDGQGLATLATGSGMFAVTLDQTAGVLYYNNDEKLMKMTVSNNVSTEVTTLTARPWNMRLYRGTIYYSSLSSQIVGAVNVAYNTSAYTLKSVGMDGVSLILLCLVP